MRFLVKKVSIIFVLLFIFYGANGFAGDKTPVFVSILPQKFFVEQIGKDLVDVRVMVLPGASPATYEPKPRQMAALSKAEIYFAIGVPFENVWLKKIAAANSKMNVIHTESGIEKLTMAAHHSHESVEGGHDEVKAHHDDKVHKDDQHTHTGFDPHVWLSPPLVKRQAQTILTALQKADPEHRNSYESNFKNFSAQVDQLHADLKAIFAGKTGLQFIVFHPSWGYFAHTYGLKQVSIEVEGKAPKPTQLKELIRYSKEKGCQVVFVQPQFSVKSAKVVAQAIGGQVVFADPLAENWVTNLREVAEKFQAALK